MGKKSRLKKLRRQNESMKNAVSKGTLSKFSDKGSSDPFMARMLYQMGEIRDFIFYTDAEKKAFRDFYEPIFQNLWEAEFVKEKCIKIIENHKKALVAGKIAKFKNGFIRLDESIDFDLNIYFKDFFIRGSIALDCLKGLTSRIFDVNIEFLFASEKKFEDGIVKFRAKHSGDLFKFFTDMLRDERKQWFSTFVDMRNKIEHKGFKLPNVQHILQNGKITGVFPLMDGKEMTIVLEILWNNLFNFCEDAVVMMFATKIKEDSGIGIIQIPPELRDDIMPVRYKIALMPPPELLKKLEFPIVDPQNPGNS